VNLLVVCIFLLYLVLGIVSDILTTAYYIFVGKGSAVPASSVSLVITLLNFWVIGKLIVDSLSWGNVIAYALGNAIGCFIIMKLSKRLKDKKNE
jgi:uncharacterized protein YebE (UPF0316 family)